MLFADWFSDALGTTCFALALFVIGFGYLLSKIASSDTAKQAAKTGFWMWFFSNRD